MKTSEMWCVGADNSEKLIVYILWVCGIYVGLNTYLLILVRKTYV